MEEINAHIKGNKGSESVPISYETFHTTDIDGCSSLLKPSNKDEYDASNKKKDGFKGYNEVLVSRCLRVIEKRRVPCISLESVISQIVYGGVGSGDKKDTTATDGIMIDTLKIDAQGFDLQVIKS